MLFITPSTNSGAAKDYYTRQLERSDYYMRDAAEMPGQWHGLGAELLGLEGEVKRQDYFSLCDNLNPETGKSLTRNTQVNRRVLYDFTFDAPKSLSLAYEVGGDERILGAFQSAVRETMGEMERDVMARVRKDGADTDRRTSNMVWAEFVHRTTRPMDDGTPDPQPHCHATAFNCTYDAVEGKWKAAQFSNLVRDKGYYQAAFHSRLAQNLADIGYGIERDKNSFGLAGFSRETCERFSRRREQIDKEAERLGIKNHDARTVIAKRTRKQKSDKSGSMEELRKEWRSRITPEEARAIFSARAGQDTPTLQAGEAMDYAISHCYERSSVTTDKELLRTALTHSVGNATVGQIWGELNRDGLILRDIDGQRYATTKRILQEELSVLNYARNGKGKYRKLGGGQEPVLSELLSAEQKQAALSILTSRDAVVGLVGRAGTGKTTTTQATAKAIEDSGRKVYAFAPSAKASRGVLRVEGFKDADTVEKLLTDAKLQHQVHGQVLWIDEAGLLSTPDMKRVFDVARRQKARVVLSGDPSQHSSVQRGDFLRVLQKNDAIAWAELTEVRRQTNKEYRNAVSLISEGDRVVDGTQTQLERGIEALDKMGAIVEVGDESRYRHLAADYIASSSDIKKDGTHKSALVVSPTHAEAEKVTQAIREGLKRVGRIKGKEREFTSLASLNLTEAQRSDYASFRQGDVVQFVQNAKGWKRGERASVVASGRDGVMVERSNGRVEELALQQAGRFQVFQAKELSLAKGDRLRITQNGFTSKTRRGGKTAKSRLDNGDIYEVSGFTKSGDIELSNGFVVPKEYGGITHGYCSTSHGSQGATVDKVLIALGSESLAAANRQQLYVSVSRGREAVRLYTDDKAAVMDAVRSDAKRLSATELMQGQKPVNTSSKTQRLIHIRKIQRAYEGIRERMKAWSWSDRDREALLAG
jgi:conjugative relaxase-like TrwC/TraI family protein